MPWPYPWPGDASGPKGSSPADDISKQATFPQPSKEDWSESFLAPGAAAALKAVEKPVYPEPVKRLGIKGLGLGAVASGLALGYLWDWFEHELDLQVLVGAQQFGFRGYYLGCSATPNLNGWHHWDQVVYSGWLAGCPVNGYAEINTAWPPAVSGTPLNITEYHRAVNATVTNGRWARVRNWAKWDNTITYVQPLVYRPVIVAEPVGSPMPNVFPDWAMPGDPALFPAPLPYKLLPHLDPAIDPLVKTAPATKPHPWTWPGGLTEWPALEPGMPPDLSWDIPVDTAPDPAPIVDPVPSPIGTPEPLPLPDGPIIGGYSPAGPWGGGNNPGTPRKNDIKVPHSKGTLALAAVAGAVTEGLDVLNAAWGALPEGMKTKVKGVQTSPWQKFKDVRDGFKNNPDVLAADGYVGNFAKELAKNLAEDTAFGLAGQKLKDSYKNNPVMKSRPVGHMVGPWDNPSSIGVGI